MNCKFINVLAFAAGAVVGSAVTWKVMQAKYEKIVQEEIESIKEAFADRQVNDDVAGEDESSEDEEESQQVNWDELEDLDPDELEEPDDEYDFDAYREAVKPYTTTKGGAEIMAERPYVISPDDFGELDGYRQISLTYYADGVLEDEDLNILTKDDIDELIGERALFTFGEYEDDSVFVRNEQLQVDFEILKDYRSYSNINAVGPDKVLDE